MIFFSLTEAPLHDPPQPHPTPRNGPEKDPKQTRNGAKRSQTDTNGAEMGRNQALSGAAAGGGGCRDEGGRGCKGKRKSLN